LIAVLINIFVIHATLMYKRNQSIANNVIGVYTILIIIVND